jgi:hypothetical protein
LNLSHVPVVWRVYEYLDDVPLHDEERDWIMENSRRIWEAMNDNHDKRLGMTPDGYLKVHGFNDSDFFPVFLGCH